MSMKWSESIMLRFLESYRKQDCLWNHRLETYRNKEARENALKAILKDMKMNELTTVEIKSKIKTIRTMYRKELTLVLKSRKNGSGAEVYKPKIFWYKVADAFLRDVSTTRDYTSNMEPTINESEVEETHETQDDCPMSPPLYVKNEIEPEVDIHISKNSTSMKITPQTAGTPKKKFGNISQNRKRKLPANINNISNMQVSYDKLYRIPETSNCNGDDEFDAFGKLVAIQLRQLPIYNALTCQEKIESVIRQERFQLLMSRSPNQLPLHSPSPSQFVETEQWSASSSSPPSPSSIEQFNNFPNS